jgi:cell division protein FtsW
VAASNSAARKPAHVRGTSQRARPSAVPERERPPADSSRRAPGGAPSRRAAGKKASPAGRARNGSEKVRPGEARALVNRTPLAYLVLIPAAALLLLGLVMVFSAGSVVGPNMQLGGYKTFLQQLAWAGLGLLLMAFFARFDYHKLGKLSWVGLFASIALLVLVLAIGKEAYGARRWIVLGPVNLQPTEIAKFALIIFAAYALSIKGDKLKEMKHLLIPVVVFAVLEAGLMLAQPDLGSALVLLFSIMLMLTVARTRGAHLAIIGGAGAAGAMFFALSAPYRRARLFSFINPWKSPRGYGYHVIQSYIALGSGNIKGLGLGMSRQKFLYLPNAHTDFIFAIIGEELGIVGTMTVICLVSLIAYGGMRIARSAPDDLGKLLAAGITGLIVIQALVNMGGVTGLLPITGVPLPLVSSGGSSLCVCMGCIGILLNIAAKSRARG